MHRRQYDVTNWRRRARIKLAWCVLRDALRLYPALLHTPAPPVRHRPLKVVFEPDAVDMTLKN